jgi:hypothetical protein
MMLDDVVEKYVDWRESARAVADASARWSCMSRPEGALRFSAYTAALDQEQNSAEAYARAVKDLALELRRSESQEGL